MSFVVAGEIIYLVEDDQKLAGLLGDYLKLHGLAVKHFPCAHEAVDAIIATPPDIVVLDLFLPDRSGHQVCQSIRNRFTGSIMMLTASEDDQDQLHALDLGVDDFVKKPLQPRVLLARINMLLKRSGREKISTQSQHELVFGKLSINQKQLTCSLAGEDVPLTPSEFSLLWQLASNAEQVQSRDQLLQSLTGLQYDGLNRTVDNKIAQIRKKLKDNQGRAKGIMTVRNKGYMFVPEFWAN